MWVRTRKLPAEPPGYDPNNKLHWLWTLHVTGGLGSMDNYALHRMDEYVRAWAVQLLCEDKKIPPEILKEFVRLAR